MAPRVGFEPTTRRLTAGCSTTELPRNSACAGGADPRRGAIAGASPAPQAAPRLDGKKKPGRSRACKVGDGGVSPTEEDERESAPERVNETLNVAPGSEGADL